MSTEEPTEDAGGRARRWAARVAAAKAAAAAQAEAAANPTASPAPQAAPPQPEPAPSQTAAPPQSPLETPDDDGLDAAATIPPSERTQAQLSEEARVELEQIKTEGLTGRQLRMARRVATVYNLPFTDDYDAVRLLRRNGIDPFSRAPSLELVSPAPSDDQPDPDGLPAMPAKGRGNPNRLPSTEVRGEEIRLRDVQMIQRDIVRRRRRKSLLLLTRLSFFIFLPTLLAFFYFRDLATPLYATKSEFVIQLAAPPGTVSPMSSSPMLTMQDSINVQAYLLSREAMLRLDKDMGFKSHFSQPKMDALQRLEMDATQEETYRVYRKMVRIGYDPTEGVLKMEVTAADGEASRAMALTLVSYAEEQVDNLTERLREEQLKGARELYAEAETKMEAAQLKVVALQERLGSIDPKSEATAVSTRISGYEDDIQTKKLELEAVLDNPKPNQARVAGLRTDIERLERAADELRLQISSADADSQSLARVNSEVRLAEIELGSRQGMMTAALQHLETARIEANRQVRYVKVNVAPVPPDEPTYPRVVPNTFLTFLILSGIYLMLSLTASILREQVSA